ncbi:hypothetical protein BT96DRAFT_811039 [Gymnopus androsaceus JB14]|uniref:Uncharacterized protein n=1 Tax=Gymnopus androsaceus JB14 TaxID=1447944 RepID=A0A6A4I8Z9_9AGAR|nr:hypothetical protein BT96DRAFT_811039 [Gymnopus androsaceus JB14]
MEIVRTKDRLIPPGRKVIQGGYEEDGTVLFHNVATIDGVKLPGKTATRLGGCNVPFRGQEYPVRDNYEIL